VILCLPDEAAREAVALIENPTVRVIDASTAHRVAEGWTYGFAELEADWPRKESPRLSVSPIPAAGRLVSSPWRGRWCGPGWCPPISRSPYMASSGYSGGGKSVIEEFGRKDSPHYVETVQRGYGLGLDHKHIPEMTRHAA